MDVKGFPIATRSAFAAALVALALGGCAPNPNGMGVADFGTVIGRVVDQQSQQPISGALVRIGNLAGQTDGTGAFAINNVPVGTQTVLISAIGWQTATITVVVRKDTVTDAGDGRLIGLVSSLNP
jgi:hypothetical protein